MQEVLLYYSKKQYRKYLPQNDTGCKFYYLISERNAGSIILQNMHREKRAHKVSIMKSHSVNRPTA